MAKAMLTFAIYRNGVVQRRERVAQDVVKIGNDPRSHVRLEDEGASRMHAIIEVEGPHAMTLIDLGNAPATLVNGAAVNKCRLCAGDEILVGSTRIVLEAASAPDAGVDATSPARAVIAPPNCAAEPPATNPFAAPAPAAWGSFNGLSARNPFAAAAAISAAEARAARFDVAPDAPPESYTYTPVKRGPDVRPEDVELQGVSSIEVMVLWGTNVLHVSHLTPPRPFFIGEEQGANLPTDYFIPSEALGTSRMPLVVGDRSASSLILPAGASGFVERPGQPRMTLEQARRHGQPTAALNGAHQIELLPGTKARIELGAFAFAVAAVNAGKPVPTGIGTSFDWDVVSYFGLSLLTHASLLAAMAFFVPPGGITEDEGISKNQLRLIQQYLASASEREQPERQTEGATSDAAADRESGTGTRSGGEEGEMGNPNSRDRNRTYAVKRSLERDEMQLAKAAAIREAIDFGLIGILNAAAKGDPNAPTAPWGRDTTIGTDEVSARGNMWGDSIGDAFGGGGLGLSGIGEGGGGRGEGIGLGTIGTFGHGAGTGPGQGFGPGGGFGVGHGRSRGGHATGAPRVRPVGQTSVSGRLPPEVIQRIVRQNYGRFRMCYEQGLARNPNLEGRVSVRFVIGRDGAVSNAANGGSDLADSGVVSCVVSMYYGLSFPQPEGGIVTVVYPILFSPG